MNLPQPSRTFATSEPSTAAYLIIGKHLRLLDVDVDVGGRGVFIFEDPKHLGSELEADRLLGYTWLSSSCDS